MQERQRNPVVHQMILAENKILQLQDKKQALTKRLTDLKDVLRKYRQKQLPIQPSYTLQNGIYTKRTTKELYPLLQKTYNKLNQQKSKINQDLIKEMKQIVKMVKGQLIGKSQLDARVFNLLLEYQTNYEDQLMSSSQDQNQ